MKVTKKGVTENVYSVDMVRLKVRVFSEDIQTFFNAFTVDSNVDYWESTKFTEYRHNWRFKYMDVFNKERSFYVGYSFNSEQKSLKHWLVIEYNPNKNDITYGYLNKILMRFFKSPVDVKVVSVDLACDMPVNITNVFCDKGGKKVRKLFDYGGDNKTIYVGQGNGRIKIYNKRKEILEKEGREIGHDLTRYEISLSCFEDFPIGHYMDDISPCIKLIPIYCISSYQFDMSLNGTDKAIIYAVLNGYPIEELTRDKRTKIKKILSESAGNTIESSGFAQAFTKYFNYHVSIIR